MVPDRITDHAFQPRENLFYDQRFFGRLQLGDIEVNAAASVLERVIIVERPERGDHDGSWCGTAVDRYMVIADVESWRAAEARGPLCRRLY